MKNIENKITELRKTLHYHNRKYYVDSAPEIMDFEYDQLYKELQTLEAEHPGLASADSPTQRVGASPAQCFSTVRHARPMLSLDNTYSESELRRFENRIKAKLPPEEIEYAVELKIDGLGISVVYENGLLVRGLTRGDGTSGEEVTQNIRTIRSIPMCVETGEPAAQAFEVRGEVYLSKKEFERINLKREENGDPAFANPRNAAAGSLRLLDSRITASRNLKVFFYYLSVPEKEAFSTQSQSLAALDSWGFKTNPHRAVCRNMDEVLDFIRLWDKERREIDYDVDGIVIKVNRLDWQERLGTTSTSPCWAVAFKYPAQQATTKIVDIVVQVGRTGILTPVAELEPIFLSGSTISRATLHNEDEIQRKDIRAGDTVFIEKGGEIIPKVLKVVVEKRTGAELPYKFPVQCIVCGAAADKLEGEVARRCSSVACAAQLKERLRYFASRPAMDIDHLGPSLIDKLVDTQMVRDVADLYYLDFQKVAEFDLMGEKSTENLKEAIEKSKQAGLRRLLHSLGIRFVGSRAAEILAENYNSMNDLIKAIEKEEAKVEEEAKENEKAKKEKGDLEFIQEIGRKIIGSLISFINEAKNLKVIHELKEAGVSMESLPSDQAGELPFKGKQFVVTGTLSSMKRDEAKERIKRLGGRVVSSITSKTDFLVCGADPGSKLKKAQGLNIPVLDELTFLEQVKE